MSDIINQKPICLYSHNYNSERLHGFKINEYLFSTNEILSYNGKYICFIGVISNIEALRRRFNIYDSDQRIVILKIYEQYALKTSNYLEGNYAVVIVDKHDVCFFRDRNSIENIYYCRNTQDNSFIISSRIKDIKEFVPLDLNPGVLPKYFLLSTISISDTFFKNIFSLKRCEIMKLNLPTGKWESLYYDDYANKPIEHLNNNSIEDSIETIIGNYIQEVKNSYPDYDLVNSFSGGVDSAYIQTVLKRNGFNSAYTAIYPGDPGNQAAQNSKELAEFLGTKQELIPLQPSEILETMRKGIMACELPYMYEGECLLKNMYQHIGNDYYKQNECPIVFDGNGADTAFGVSKKLYQMRYLQLFNIWKLFDKGSKIINTIDKRLIENIAFMINAIKKQTIDGTFLINFFCNQNIANRVIDAFDIKHPDEIFKQELSEFNKYETEFIEKVYRLKLFEFELNRESKLAYQNGKIANVIVLFPFQSDDFLQYIINVPLKNKIKGLSAKYHQRQLLKRYIPKYMVDRRKFGHRTGKSHLDIVFQNDEYRKNYVEELKAAKYQSMFNFDYDEIFTNVSYETIALKLINLHLLYQELINK